MDINLISFYCFADFIEYKCWKPFLEKLCTSLRGTIILSPEGVNVSLAGEEKQLSAVVNFFTKDKRFTNMDIKKNKIEKIPFRRMKIKCKKEIITFRSAGNAPDKELTPHGRMTKRLNPQEWNNLIEDENTIVLDTRNNFECEMGSFPNAINPRVNYFSEMAEYVNKHKEKLKDKPIAIFCTGGIRCEKLANYMLHQGIKQVYQLNSGILGYMQKVKKSDNLWQGNCFVFDERINVNSNGD